MAKNFLDLTASVDIVYDDQAIISMLEGATIPCLEDIAKDTVRIAKGSMKKIPPRIGPRGGVYPVPSAPGTPPNRQTDALYNSIAYEQVGEAFIVGTPIIYGGVHEYGGRFHPMRPYLAPAAKKAKANKANYGRFNLWRNKFALQIASSLKALGLKVNKW